MGFWQNVEIERTYVGMTRKELAAKAEITYASIGIGLERNSIPVADAALRIAKALNVSLEYLLTGDETKRNAAFMQEYGHISATLEKMARYSRTIQNIDSLPENTKSSLISMIDMMAQDMKKPKASRPKSEASEQV
ncbi:MAG: helix-turn-helix domain-containing protein [Treponema sp.]|nr:helix-turn-helix domain-containing protein [Treponema sp.]